MKLKRYPKSVIKKYIVEQLQLLPKDVSPSEPHQIVRCLVCDEPKRLEFRRDGNDQMYYRCHRCGFESEAMGPAPAHIK